MSEVVDGEEQQDEQQPYNPVVRVPSKEGPVTAPLDVATQWDERIWGRS